jgi:hypothetical protein
MSRMEVFYRSGLCGCDKQYMLSGIFWQLPHGLLLHRDGARPALTLAYQKHSLTPLGWQSEIEDIQLF